MKTKRALWVDNIRALATVLVVLCHVTESIYSLNLEGMELLSDWEQITVLIMFTLGRLGVPIFFFLSGYLLLGFEYDEERTKKFYSRNLLGLMITTEIWLLVYRVYNSFFYHMPFSLKECIKTALFLTQGPMTHTWYMPVILGIYTMVPAVSNALCSRNRLFLIPLSFSFVATFVIPEVNVLMRLKGIPEISFFLDLSFVGGGYGFCVLLGYILRRHLEDFRRVPMVIWALIAISQLCITVLLQWYSYHCGTAYNVWYNCGTLLLAAFSLTIMGSNFSRERKITHFLSKYSFGIYLLHVPALQIIMRFFHIQVRSLLSVGILSIAVVTVSLLLCALCCQETHVARVCFFVKDDNRNKRRK